MTIEFPFALPSVMKLPEFKPKPYSLYPSVPSFVSDIETVKVPDWGEENEMDGVTITHPSLFPLTFTSLLLKVCDHED